MSDEPRKLRMAPAEPAAELERRVEHEQRSLRNQRETNLDKSLGSFRVGSVKALNAVPLSRGLEEEIVYAPPSKLAVMLRNNELDAALVSIVEVLFTGKYDLLDGIGIACLGEVQSVFLAHKKSLEEAREIYCDTASLTSVQLMRVLLAERGIRPELKPLPSYDFKSLPDFALLIGDNALDFALGSHEHEIWDLGQAWFEHTKLPFVFAGWALRPDIDTRELRRLLREARDFGLDTLDTIVRTRTEYTYEFRKDYLGWHIHYHIGADEKRGIAKFIELLRKHSDHPVFDPKFVI